MAVASLLVRKLVSQFSSNKESCKKRPLEILRFCITGCSNWEGIKRLVQWNRGFEFSKNVMVVTSNHYWQTWSGWMCRPNAISYTRHKQTQMTLQNSIWVCLAKYKFGAASWNWKQIRKHIQLKKTGVREFCNWGRLLTSTSDFNRRSFFSVWKKLTY